MPSYHSLIKETNNFPKACDVVLIPFSKEKQPNLDYKSFKNSNNFDIIDEAIAYFRANVLFKSFSIKVDSDKLIVYLSVFISKCLNVIAESYNDIKKSKELLRQLILECEWSSNLKSHFLNSIITLTPNEIPELQKYLKGLREETIFRLNYILFDSPGAGLDIKYWIGYHKKLFLGYEMPQVKKYN